MKRFIIGLIIPLILALVSLPIGCSREIESPELDFGQAEAPPVPNMLTITYLNEAVILSWQCPDTLAGMMFNVYYSDAADGVYTSWEKTAAFSSVITGLIPGRPYYFRVATITESGLEGYKSDPVTAGIGVLALTVNGGDLYTNSRNVTVDFITPLTATLMQLSEDTSFTDIPWMDFLATTDFRFSGGFGMKYVYARLQFADGATSDVLTDSIFYDNYTRINSVYFLPAGVIFARDDTITFHMVTAEAEGEATVVFPGINPLNMTYDENLSQPQDSLHVYRREYIVPANVEIVEGQVTGYFTDAAGNEAEPVAADVLLNISNPPTPVSLSAVAESSSAIRLTWSMAIDNDFTAYQIYRGPDNTVSNNTDPVAIISDRNTLTFIDTGLDENTRYFYRVYVYDLTGLFAPSGDADALTLINEPPEPVILAARLENQDGADLAVLSWTENQDGDFASYRIYHTTVAADTLDYGQTELLGIINLRSGTSFTSPLPAISGNYYYAVIVFDQQGKAAPSGWAVISK